MKPTLLDALISPAKVMRCGDSELPVLSMTMHDGLVLQKDRFSKVIASKDLSQYKIVEKNQLVVSFPIDEGVLAVQSVVPRGIVSPAYAIWDIDQTQIVPEYLEIALRSPKSIQYYKSKLKGTTARRRSIRQSDFLAMSFALPSLQVQHEILGNIRAIKSLVSKREEQLSKLDQLAKSRFIEMFGDPIRNPKGWSMDELDAHIDVLTGYPFDSSKYVADGIKICGGLIIMPGRIEWDACKNWVSVDGLEEYLLQAGDIVLALDRPWISDGFKIACVGEDELPCLLIQRTARIRGRDMNQRFLYAMLNSDAFQAHCTITGSLVPHISHKDIKNFRTILPPLSMQNEFAAFIEQLDKSKVTIRKSLEKLNQTYRALLQEYFG